MWPVLILVTSPAGSGERSHSPPGDGTETIAASDFLYTCAGVYQTTNLANHTTPLTEVLNKSSSRSWLFTTSIDIYHLYEVGAADLSGYTKRRGHVL